MLVRIVVLMLAVGLVSAETPSHEDWGVRIQLPRRGTLVNSDGSFNHDKAIAHNLKVANKYRQNYLNLQRNGVTLPDHMFLASVDAVTSNAASTVQVLERRQKVHLQDEEEDVEWAGGVQIGSPPTTFLIDFDTGSADLWMPSSDCTSCGAKWKYNATASSTGTLQNGTFSIRYADGSNVSGPIYTDTVTVGGIRAEQQYFAAVTSESSMFSEDPIDGVLGLAFPPISRLKKNPFFVTANAQNATKQNVFAFKLASNGSELYLGGTNTALYNGSIEFHNLSSNIGYWIIGGASALVGGVNVVSGFETVIDSGTSIMYGPPAAVKEFYAAIPNSTVFDADNGYYAYPCDAPPTVAFSWGGTPWSISPANFNLGETETGSGQCVGTLAGQDFGLGNNTWLLGDSFMKNVYSVFSFSEGAVGFAALN